MDLQMAILYIIWSNQHNEPARSLHVFMVNNYHVHFISRNKIKLIKFTQFITCTFFFFIKIASYKCSKVKDREFADFTVWTNLTFIYDRLSIAGFAARYRNNFYIIQHRSLWITKYHHQDISCKHISLKNKVTLA